MKLKSILLLGASVMMASASYAGTQDSEGYPVFYLAGDQIGNWDRNPENQFTREGNVYTLTLETLSGEFKVTDDDWAINFGGNYTISHTIDVTGIGNGPNFKADGTLNNVTISFEYDRNNWTSALIHFEVGAREVAGLSGTLPVLYINVYREDGVTYDNEVIDYNLDHKNYFAGNYWLDLNGCEWLAEEGAKSIGSAEEPLPLQIKARGNWTRKGFSKKPFKLKLDKKQSMLGMSKSKHYAILAHADDNFGYLRNFTGFNLGQRIGLPWTPSQQPVEVVINGDYRGLYFLTESIRIEEERINITELADNEQDKSLCSGGYLVELDNYDEDSASQIQMEEKYCAWTPVRDVLRITFDTPEEYSDVQREFVQQQFTAMNDYVGGNNDMLWSYMDMDDAARYYLVEEIVSHTESYHGSTYLFRDRGENQKWHFSPLWDFGNAFSGPTDDFFYHHGPYGNTWIPSMRQNEKFNERVRETWKWFMANEYEGLFDDIDSYVDHIAAAAKADHERWNNQPVPNGGMPVVDNSDMNGRRNAVKEHLNHKIGWLSQQFGDFSNGFYAEPERDTTPAAPLPEDFVSGSSVVTVGQDGPAVYYNLQGLRIEKPTSGELYIVRRGDTVSKEMRR